MDRQRRRPQALRLCGASTGWAFRSLPLPTLFRVTRIRNTQYFDVWAGEMPSRRAHLVELGWRSVEISRELSSMRKLQRKNTTKTNSLGVSLQYVFDFIEPGDVLWVESIITVRSG